VSAPVRIALLIGGVLGALGGRATWRVAPSYADDQARWWRREWMRRPSFVAMRANAIGIWGLSVFFVVMAVLNP